MDLMLDDEGRFIVPPKLVSGADAVKQALLIRLQFFMGEWFLDTSAGIPYYQTVLKKQRRGLREVNAIFKNEILDTPGVLSLITFDATINGRAYFAEFRVNTIFGPIDAEFPTG